MRVLHVTNIISHHQLPLAREIANRIGESRFRFAATALPDAERLRLGWSGVGNENWILRPSEDENHRKLFTQWWEEADVVICGERLLHRMRERISRGKLTFYMSERWWKPPLGMARLISPRFALMVRHFSKLAASDLFHYLPMGGLAATDMKRIAPFTNRMWQWGYFTELPNPMLFCKKKDDEFKVLWVGRMLSWKRVDTLIRAFKILQQKRSDASLLLVGDGPDRQRLEKLAAEILSPGCYEFKPPIPVPQVLELMRSHDVYVLPSNGYEGWGAVLNESMAAGCAVVASRLAGSAATLIQHGVNGILFTSGDHTSLGRSLIQLATNRTLRLELSAAGQKTISQLWSPSIAADRFLAVSEALLTKNPAPNFYNGPMAPI